MPGTMDPEMTILPKGIVVNSQKIYREIAGYDKVPRDRVWEIWRVYTTTTKELQDPTARRLENFWWHVLGSERQNLSGQTLARLFEDISVGPTAVPLKGPPNRWDGDIPPHIIQQAMAILEEEKQHPHQSETALHETRRLRDLSSSAAKPPPSHPILKKPRGPSASGARPTARFVSPHPSDDEADKESAPSSTSTITPGLEMRQRVASPSKKKAHAKKFVASTGAAKKRPVLPRKNSSHSSGVSDSSSRDGPSSGSSRGSGTPIRAPSPILEGKPYQTSSTSDEPTQPSAKALGKRPMLARRPTDERLKTTNETTQPTSDRSSEHNARTPKISQMQRSPSPLKSPTTSTPTISESRPLDNISNSARTSSFSSARSTASERVGNTAPTSTSTTSGSLTSVPMAQSRSHSGFIRPRESHSHSQSSGAPTRALFTRATTASTTDVAAQGTIIDQGGSVDSIPIPAFYSRQTINRNPSSSSLLDPQFTPTQPSPSASVPLGRTKSQLTLLLEKDEARAGKNQKWKSKS